MPYESVIRELADSSLVKRKLSRSEECPFELLESRGFDVKLVNAHHIKNVPGRKTDVVDCQWIQQLHTFGLLSGSFRPDDEICVLRAHMRQHDNLPGCSTH